MKIMRTLLLGSAVGLMAVSAQAADLPARKAAPIEYVRVCSTYGEGFFYVPGTDSCLRITGRVRAELLYNEPFARANDSIGFRARGRIQLDHRTSTAYGLLRSVVRLESTADSGTPFGFQGTTSNTGSVAQAFIQFGGLTAGRTTSFFDNGDLPTAHFGTLRFSDAPDLSLFAYTFSFGNGFSSTIAIEDGYSRRNSTAPIGVFPGPALDPIELVYAGQTLPDVVGNVKYAGTWGSAQLSGALHQIRDAGTLTREFADTEYGFAATAQVGVNLPFLGAGDAAWFAATYANGAPGYLGFGTNAAFGTIDAIAVTDAYVDPITNDLEKSKGWSIAGGLTHNWTPAFRSSLFGSYARVEYDGSATAVAADGASVGFVDFSEYRIGGNTIWTPVSGLDVGVEVIYAKIDPRGRVAGTISGAPVLVNSDSLIEGRLRVQRDF